MQDTGIRKERERNDMYIDGDSIIYKYKGGVEILTVCICVQL